MNCDICKTEEAGISAKIIFNGKINLLNLCYNCASLYGYTEDKKTYTPTLEDYANAIIEDLDKNIKKLICKNCKTTYIDFIRNKEIGCSYCYISFEKLFKKIIEFHYGKICICKNENPIEELYDNRIEKILELEKKLKTYIAFDDLDMVKKTLEKLKKIKNDNIK